MDIIFSMKKLCLCLKIIFLTFILIFVCSYFSYSYSEDSKNSSTLSSEEIKPTAITNHNPLPAIKAKSSSNTREDAEKEAGIHLHSAGIGIGETFLGGDFANHGEDKITFDFFYGYSASHSFDFLANLHRSTHEYKGEQVIVQGIALGIKGKFYQFDSFSPFAEGGFGFYRPIVTRKIEGTLTESEGKTAFGMHLGAGIDLKLNKNVAVGMLMQYHDPFNIKQDIGPEIQGYYFKIMMIAAYCFDI
ncbi:MAG: outer membrane beta-barrel protein [Oligoflexia bacterium]|nr:outer membrane beta-barrel protein [Oligoflexia bacterium]